MSLTQDDISAAVEESLNGGSVTTPLRASIGQAANADPKYEAELTRISRKTGVPIETARNMTKDVKRVEYTGQFDYEKMSREFPRTTAFLEDAENAKIARNDVDRLTALETAWQSMSAVGHGLDAGTVKSQSMMLNYKKAIGTISPDEVLERSRLKDQMELDSKKYSEGAPSWFRAAGDIVGMNVQSVAKAISDTGAKGAALGMVTGAGLGFVGGPGAPVTVPAGALAMGAKGLLVGTTAGYLNNLYESTVGEAYGDLEDFKDKNGARIDPTVARYAALLIGVPNSALETFALGKALKMIPGTDKLLGAITGDQMKRILAKPTVTAALKDFGKKYAVAVGSETFTEGLQKFVNIIGRELAQEFDEKFVAKGNKFSDYDQDQLKEDARDILAEATEAFKGMVVLGAGGAVPKVIQTKRQFAEADRAQEFFKALGEHVENSEQHKNLPEQTRKFVETLKAGGDINNVYVPVEKWDALFQTDQDPNGGARAATEVLGTTNAYAEAKAVNGDLAIPIEVYAEKLAGSEAHAKLLADLRLRPGDLTASERAAAEPKEKDIAERVRLAVDEMMKTEESHRRVYEDVYEQLVSVGRDRTTAQREALLASERERVRAKRLGKDAWELYSENPLKLRRAAPEVVKQIPEEKLDALIREIRVQNEQQNPNNVAFKEWLEARGAEIAQEGVKTTGEYPLDVLASLAYEEGWIDRASPDALVVAANSVAGGGTVQRGESQRQTGAISRQVAELSRYLASIGADPLEMTNEEVRAAIKKAMGAEPQGDQLEQVPNPFPDSKVQNVVYHGTNRNVRKFSENKIGRNFGLDNSQGFYFTNDPEEAGAFADYAEGYTSKTRGQNIIPAYLNIKNPFVLTEKDVIEAGYENGMDMIDHLDLAELRDKGHDGVVVAYEEFKTYVVFDHRQIASAIDGKLMQQDATVDGHPAMNHDGRPIHPTEEGIRNFWKWFGQSSTTDFDGKPLVMYHGSSRDFSEFKAKQAKAIYVTTDIDLAKEFTDYSMDYAAKNNIQGAAPVIYPLYVKADRPFDFENDQHVDEFAAWMEKNKITDNDISVDAAAKSVRGIWDTKNKLLYAMREGSWGAVEHPVTQRFIHENAFDGFWVMEAGAKNLAVFDPAQLKSAIGNKGTFSRMHNDILFQQDLPTFYSELQAKVTALGPNQAPPQQWKDLINGLSTRGVKKDEIEWSGVMEWLDTQQGKVKKADVIAFLDQNGVKVEEVVYGEGHMASVAQLTDELQRRGAHLYDREAYDGKRWHEIADVYEVDPESKFIVAWQLYESSLADSTISDEDYAEAMDMGLSDLRKLPYVVAVGETPDTAAVGFIEELEYAASQMEEMGHERVAEMYNELAQTMRTYFPDEGADGGVHVAGAAHYSSYQLPGGQNYRELLLTLPVKEEPGSKDVFRIVERDGEFEVLDLAGNVRGVFEDSERAVDLQMELEAAQGDHDDSPVAVNNFQSGHWDPTNVIAHVRFNERTDAEGKRVLFVEEVQSDWAQQGREEGFRSIEDEKGAAHDQYKAVMDEAMDALASADFAGRKVPRAAMEDWTDQTVINALEDKGFQDIADRLVAAKDALNRTTGVPRAPFVEKTEAWSGLVMKRMLRWAVENGFDKVAWTTGDQQNKRYSLGSHFSAVRVYMSEPGYYSIAAIPFGGRGGERGSVREVYSARELPNVVGAELAEKIIKDLEHATTLRDVTDLVKARVRELADIEADKDNYEIKHRLRAIAENLRPGERPYWIREQNGGYDGIVHKSGIANDEVRSIVQSDEILDGLLKEWDLITSFGRDGEEYKNSQSWRNYEGLDLEVGGEGMRGFYDKMLPNMVNDLLKKVGGGGRVSQMEIKDASKEATFDDKQQDITYAVVPYGAGRPQRYAVRAFDDGEPVSFFSERHGWTQNPTEVSYFNSEEEAQAIIDAGSKSFRFVMTQPGFEITDKVRDKVMQGLPLFQLNRDRNIQLSNDQIDAEIERIIEVMEEIDSESISIGNSEPDNETTQKKLADLTRQYQALDVIVTVLKNHGKMLDRDKDGKEAQFNRFYYRLNEEGEVVAAAHTYDQEGKKTEIKWIGSSVRGAGARMVLDIARDAKKAGSTKLVGEAAFDSHSFWEGFGAEMTESVDQNLSAMFSNIAGKSEVSLAKLEAKFGKRMMQPGGARGMYQPSSRTITLLEKANFSTVVHELGHDWLEELRADAQRPDAPQQIVDDWRRIAMWAGIPTELPAGVPIPREAHEKFARGAEAYVMEGNAPSLQLRTAFAQFKDWLVRLYRHMANLNVQLTDEVRGVFDRMLATDEEIAQAREAAGLVRDLFGPTDKDMTQAERDALADLSLQARLEAEENVRARVLRELTREKHEWWGKEKKRIRQEVDAELDVMPVYKAIKWLRTGKPEIQDAIHAKLSKTELAGRWGDDVLSRLNQLQVYQVEGGLHPDVAAQLLGFESGDALVQAILAAPARTKHAENLTEQRLIGQHGDLIREGKLADEAMRRVHSDRQAQVFMMEMQILRRKGSTREMSTIDIFKTVARNMISGKQVSGLHPDYYLAAELRSGEEAIKLAAKGDWDGAFEAKQRQMLNHFLFIEASAKKDAVEDALKRFKKMFKPDERLSKTRDMNMVNAARSIAASYGIGASSSSAHEFLALLEKYDEQTYDDIREVVDLATVDPKPWKQLTVEEFAQMANAIDSLWTMSRRSRQMEIDGKMIDRKVVLDQLVARIQDISKPEARRGYAHAVGPWDKFKIGMMGARAALRRTEFWADAMDAGDSGPFRKYIWEPISKAADRFRDEHKAVLQKYLDLVKPIEQRLTADKIDAHEIGYTFGEGGSGRAELLGAMLHVGNYSNLQKLLRGRKWGDFDIEGNLDTSKWDAFIARMHRENVITKADWDFIQSVWDLMESMKPAAQKAHKDMYGFYFDEVSANSFKTPFGEYRGGYAPAIVDPFVSEDAAIHRDREELLEGKANSFMFPTTGRGFTKKRVEAYAKPLALDLRFLPTHLDKVLRFTYIEPHVKDVGRIVTNRQFREHLAQLDPEVGRKMLVPWLQRSARQVLEEPTQFPLIDKFFREVRRRTGMQIMVGNVVNALQQVTGLSIAALKIRPHQLARALWKYTRSPFEMSENVSLKSSFMRNRLTAQSFEIQKKLDDLLLNPSKYEKARDFADRHGYFLQRGTQNVVDHIVWLAAYDQALETKVDEEEAIKRADSAVRQTQGTFAPEDQSRFETQNAFTRAFTMFYSYFNMQANTLSTEFVKTIRAMGYAKGAPHMLYIYTFGFMIPAVIAEAIVQLFSAEAQTDDDDDGYLDNILSIFFMGQVRTAAGMVPIVGPTVMAGVNAFNDKWYDDRISTSATVSALESAVRAPNSIYRYLAEDGSAKRAIKDTLTMIGMLSGLPIAWLGRPLGYLADVDQGKTEPTGPVDMARGLISGKSPPQGGR